MRRAVVSPFLLRVDLNEQSLSTATMNAPHQEDVEAPSAFSWPSGRFIFFESTEANSCLSSNPNSALSTSRRTFSCTRSSPSDSVSALRDGDVLAARSCSGCADGDADDGDPSVLARRRDGLSMCIRASSSASPERFRAAPERRRGSAMLLFLSRKRCQN